MQQLKLLAFAYIWGIGDSPLGKGQCTMITNQSDTNTACRKVFISYSWDSETHKSWVLQLAESLISNGLDVILDQYELRAGKNLTHFMEKSVAEADKVLLILTRNYKLKAEGRLGGVGFEYSMINEELYRNQVENRKMIPIVREGNSETSIPKFIRSFIWQNMSDDNSWQTDFETLLREIYDEPLLKKPPIGNKPLFRSSLSGITELSNVKSVKDFPWLERSPDYIETFDFENLKSPVFKNYDEDIWSGTREDGTFKLINSHDKTAVKFHHVNYNNQDMSGFATTVEVKIKEGNDSNSLCGLQSCYDPKLKQYYSFTINNSKQYKLWLKTSSGYRTIASERSNLIIPNDFNKLGLIKLGGIVYLFINDKFLRSIHESSIEKGDSGIIAFSLGEFVFDNLSFYKL